MSDGFRKLCDDFNESAAKISGGSGSVEVMLLRFSALLKHKAETDEDRVALVKGLYDCGINMLNRHTGPVKETYVYDYHVARVKAVFETLQKPDSVKYLPEKSSQELTDLALVFLANADLAENTDFQSYKRQREYIDGMVALSRTVLQTADAVRDDAVSREIDIRTGRDITATKRITLKKPEV